MLNSEWGYTGLSLQLGNTQLYSGTKATLVNILREQGNEPNFGGHGVWRLGELFWDFCN